MNWWGKMIGGAFGFLLGGPLGAALGAAVGHNFDTEKQRAQRHNDSADPRRAPPRDYSQVETTQTAFFTATFTLMGHLAKADGLITRPEIAVAEQVMQQMKLSAEQRQVAMALFAEGKKPGFDAEAALSQLRSEAHRGRYLLQMFLEIQCAVALADGDLQPIERQVLARWAELLGFDKADYQLILQRLKAGRHQEQASEEQSMASKLAAARKVLGVERTASTEEVKRAYRRLMSQHHPDKLVAKGLPQEMMDLAAKKTAEIKDAYELLKRVR
jgi:DnaJ like chaperone protein